MSERTSGTPRRREHDPRADRAGYPVGQVAAVAGVTVRTLHHYDEIGLLSPGGRTAAGYRRYSDADLERLQHVLYYRDLGFTLEEIATLVDDPRADALAHLRRQHALLTARIDRLHTMLAAVEFALEAQQMGLSLTPEERFEVFGDADPAGHAAEAEERWGNTDAYRQSRRRTASYTKKDWLRITAEAADLERRWAAAMDTAVPAGSDQATEVAEEHRAHITRWFYDCDHDAHRGLAGMYVDDPRFAAHYDAVAPGLARYVHDAITANADRRGSAP